MSPSKPAISIESGRWSFTLPTLISILLAALAVGTAIAKFATTDDLLELKGEHGQKIGALREDVNALKLKMELHDRARPPRL